MDLLLVKVNYIPKLKFIFKAQVIHHLFLNHQSHSLVLIIQFRCCFRFRFDIFSLRYQCFIK